jgi:hypothetical protein
VIFSIAAHPWSNPCVQVVEANGADGRKGGKCSSGVAEPEIMDKGVGPKKLWTGGRSKEFQP